MLKNPFILAAFAYRNLTSGFVFVFASSTLRFHVSLITSRFTPKRLPYLYLIVRSVRAFRFAHQFRETNGSGRVGLNALVLHSVNHIIQSTNLYITSPRVHNIAKELSSLIPEP